MSGRFVVLSLSLVVVGASCSSDRADGRTEISLTWFFANGGDCGTNNVDEIFIKANRTGENAQTVRVACGDASTTFPPDGGNLAAGTWTLSAQALDGNGQTCFQEDTEQLLVDAGDQPNLRLIFHKKEAGLSAACADIEDDVDGGVPDPEPDGGGEGEGEGEGELGVDVEKIGEPSWEPDGFVIVSLPVAGETVAEVASALSTALAFGQEADPHHSMDAAGTVSWGGSHNPPFDQEIKDQLSTNGLTFLETLPEASFASPNMLVWSFVLVPRLGADEGDTPDGDLPMIPDNLFPITIEGDLVKGDQVFDPDLDGELTGMGVREAPFDGFSHYPFFAFSNASAGPEGADLLGRYEFQFELTDATGDGWRIFQSFRVE